MFKIITIPFDRNTKGFNDDLLNQFILNKHVNRYQAEFFQEGSEKYWTVFVEYDPLVEKTGEKITAALDEPQRLLFERLKAWRKERGGQDGVPVYIVGTNKELIDHDSVVHCRNDAALTAIRALQNLKLLQVAYSPRCSET